MTTQGSVFSIAHFANMTTQGSVFSIAHFANDVNI